MQKAIDKLSALNLEEEAQSLVRLAARQASLQYQLPVLGGMKAGKSTLLSRLLDVPESFFPKDVVEATARNIFVTGGGLEPSRYYVNTQGEKTEVTDDELWSQLVCGKSAQPFEHLGISLPNDMLCASNLSFVDTPGNNTVDDRKVSETWKALADAQSGIYCLKATSLMEKSDLDFIEEARYYVNNFIFVVTRIDEAGGRSFDSEIAQKQVLNAKRRLAELNIEPLAILAVGSKIPSLADSGILELRKTIQDVISRFGQRLRVQQVMLDGKRILAESKSRIENELQLTRKVMESSSSEFAEQRGDLDAKLIELDAQKENAIRSLQINIEHLEQTTRRDISELSSQTMERLTQRLEGMASYNDASEQGEGIVRSELDKWRMDAQERLNALPERISDLQVSSAQAFVGSLHDRISSSMQVDLSISLAPLTEDSSTQEAMSKYIEALGQQQKQLLEQIEELQKELEESGEKLPELEEKLRQSKEKLNALQYEPVFKEVEKPVEQRGGAAQLFKTIGAIADLATFFLPNGWITGTAKASVATAKVGKVLGSSAQVGAKTGKLLAEGTAQIGKKVGQLVENGQKLGQILPRTPLPLPPKSNPLEALQMLSLEYWGEKIGSLLDGPPPPPETELVEDPVVKAQFETTQGNLQSDYEQASSRLHSVENHRESIMQRINELEKANRQTSLEYEQAKEEARQAQVEMKKANDRKMLSQWKQEMLSKVRGLLFSHQSEMLQPVLSSLHTFCLKCRDEAKSVLAQRMDATVTQVKDELEKKKSLFAASQSELEPRIKLQQEQVRCLNELLDADENLWAQ